MAYPHYSIILLVSILLASCSVVVMDFDGKLMSRICSGKLFHFGSEYHFAVQDITNDLLLHTWESPDLDYYCQDTHLAESLYGRDVTLYGHGVCTSSLSPKDCSDCIRYADSEMFKDCTHSEGAQIHLMDCHLRYENYKFNNDM